MTISHQCMIQSQGNLRAGGKTAWLCKALARTSVADLIAALMHMPCLHVARRRPSGLPVEPVLCYSEKFLQCTVGKSLSVQRLQLLGQSTPRVLQIRRQHLLVEGFLMTRLVKRINLRCLLFHLLVGAEAAENERLNSWPTSKRQSILCAQKE